MKQMLSLIIILSLLPVKISAVSSGTDFDRHFLNRTMRVDYYHGGAADIESISIDRVYEQPVWAGSRRSVVDPFNNGRYCVRVYAAESGELIFSRGFNSYFGEYRTTDDAIKGIRRTYHETVLMPFPRAAVRFEIAGRNRDNRLEVIFEQLINPGSVDVSRENRAVDVKVFELLKSGPAREKVDLVIVADGYTAADEALLQKDLNSSMENLFAYEPFRSIRDRFNVYGIFRPSLESGPDEPRKGVYRNTSAGSSFNALGLARYMLTEENRALYDLVSAVPCDALVVMVNSDRYGGGGIYNSFCSFTARNQRSRYLFIHEFGHSFAGLADEYYTSAVAYNEFYPQGVEPLEPNITALLEPNSLKWRQFLSPGIKIPTPWEKEAYDSLATRYNKKRQELSAQLSELKSGEASRRQIEGLEKRIAGLGREQSREGDNLLTQAKLINKVGAFEGAGYAAKGLYRPMLNCIMFTSSTAHFCRVCNDHILKVVDFYSGKD